MSYLTRERDVVILAIGAGEISIDSLPIYEELEKFNWVYIQRLDGQFQGITLTYSGKELLNQLRKNNLPT